MKHLCLRSATALTVAVSMAGFVTPLGADDAVNAYGERVAWWRAPAPVPARDVARYDGPWHYDATTGYYYSWSYYDNPPRYYRAPRVYYEEPRVYPSASTGVVDRIEIVRRGEDRRVRDDEAFRVTVLLDNGAYHTVMLDRVVDLRTGDRVRLEGNTLFRG
jgi:hypothetical protein